MAFSFRVEEGRSFTKTIALAGRLDTDSALDLEGPLDSVLASAIKVLVFDLSGLEYITSAGLRLLMRAQKSMAARSGEVLMLNPQPPVRKVFDIVKATDVSQVFRSVAELDAYLDVMQKGVSDIE